MKKFVFLKTYFSPFKPLKLKFYIGETAIGTPYFLPRVWKKTTPKQAEEAAKEEIERIKQYNERNSHIEGFKPRQIKPFEVYYNSKLQCQFSSPKKIGFDFVGLGWKTKWESNNFRFEYSPIWSFVFFGYQIAIIFQAPHENHYWESWLFYELETDKNKTKIERIKDMRTRSPQIWTKWDGNEKIKVDYHDVVLKKRYVK